MAEALILPEHISPEAAFQGWRKYVQQYTTCDLLSGRDKLPEISDLAAVFQKQFPRGSRPTYLAGIWREDINPSLLWRRDKRHVAQERPRDAMVPSWSWAFWNGPILFEAEDILAESKIKVCDASTELAERDYPFGRVLWGHLKLEGMVLLYAALLTAKQRQDTLPAPEIHLDDDGYFPENDCLLLVNDRAGLLLQFTGPATARWCRRFGMCKGPKDIDLDYWDFYAALTRMTLSIS
ncbi:hypothetical protein ETB97_008756 [Aspergillus alliaceus]|uniref:Uncharacterized protein n=1 Tax=Petromyces alliaceus TaxID=209559 RepID=A0A8H6AD01_PETAA|nr:hypothetical protein ETB97_008756 [Aspergillus burnettii]